MLKKIFLMIILATALSGCAGYGGYAHHGSYPGPDTQGSSNY